MSGASSGRRKNSPRSCLIRLAFAMLVFVYVGLTVFTSSRAVPREVIVQNERFSSKVSVPEEGSNVTKPTSRRKDTEKVALALAKKVLKNSSTLDDKTLEMQKALASSINGGKAKTKPKPKAKANKARFRGTQEKALQKRLGIKLDNSPFDAPFLHKSLKEFYEDIPTQSNSTFLWEEPGVRLPEWAKRYPRWHYHVRLTISNSSDAHTLHGGEPVKFLLMQCMSTDSHCGGVSDRLKPFPLILRIAYYSKRLLLIYWNRPGHLESFLLPPRGGINWKAPSWMIPQIRDADYGVFTFNEDLVRPWSRTNLTLVRSRFQDYHGGRYAYDEQLVEGEPNFASVFYDFWRIAFTPSPPVRAVLESDMERLGLVPGQYVAAHLRALYGIRDCPEQITFNWARNAVNCASELRPRTRIFFVSDSMDATRVAEQYGVQRNASVITRVPNPNPPFHMDKVGDWRRRNISDFYDSFIDVYIMGQADCVTYNKGGYGLLGLFMSRNASCGLRQDALDRISIHHPCQWVDDPQNGTQVTRDSIPRVPIVIGKTIYEEPLQDVNEIAAG